VTALAITVREAEAFERDVSFRLPFHYGSVVLEAAPEIVLRVVVETADGRHAEGFSAELAAPKWFDKDPALSHADNFDQLRDATDAAARSALGIGEVMTPARLSVAVANDEGRHRRRPTGNGLVDAFGVSLVDRAVVDALCRLEGSSLTNLLRTNAVGLDFAFFAPDLAAVDAGRWLAARTPLDRTAIRHTVGFDDPLRPADVRSRPADGWPVALSEVIAVDGVRRFKIKLSGTVAADIARLTAVADLLDGTLPAYGATLDANEQFADAGALADFYAAVAAEPRLRRLWASTLYVEQPLPRRRALGGDLSALSAVKPIIIDESDDGYGAAIEARRCGYRGVSVKTCKGFYKSLVNAARAEAWNTEGRGSGGNGTGRDGAGGFQLSAEDLSAQAGFALHQNLALWSFLGLEDSERNGHHYGPGLSRLPAVERDAFASAHADLYAGGRLCITGGTVALATVNAAAGFGTAVAVTFPAMAEPPVTGRPMTVE
jgi:hypothetical protein